MMNLFVLHLVFLAPTFGKAMWFFGIQFVLEFVLIGSILSPGTDEFIRTIFEITFWRLAAIVLMHVIFHREIKRHVTGRRSILKWQQQVGILEYQSDAIVARTASQSGPGEEPNFIFQNQKSKELFKCDLVRPDNSSADQTAE